MHIPDALTSITQSIFDRITALVFIAQPGLLKITSQNKGLNTA